MLWMFRVNARWLMLSWLLLLLPASSFAGSVADRARFEIGVLGSFTQLDDELVGANADSFEPSIGVFLSGQLYRQWNWYADLLFTDFETSTFRGDGDSITGRAAVEYTWGAPGRSRWFASAGWGWSEMTFDNATDFSSAFASVGIGQRVPVGRRTRLRFELRASRSLTEDGLLGEDLTNIDALVGLGWSLGGVRDNDRDGVVNARDRCPHTAAGVQVDRDGCPVVVPNYPQPARRLVPQKSPVRKEPVDADQDGVPDDRDRCLRTLRGVEVDEDGCPLDRDGDGVYDGLGMDRCLGTPKGAKVDRFGCPLDGDGDGVFDGLDACPTSAPGAQVDERGC